MKQLGILDSAFINLEQSNTPQHVGGLGIYDPSTAPGGFVRFKDVIANFEQRLQRLPLFRTRLVEVPGGLDRPYWVKDANFDVEFHLRHIALPEPGDWRQLCIQIARLHQRPLDMSRPLWEAYIIEGLDKIPGLPEGSFAVYTKMHHSLVDGAGGSSFMAALHDLEPNPKPEEASLEGQPMLVDRNPSNSELLGRAAFNQVKSSIDLVRGTAGLTAELGKFALKIARKQIPLPDIQAPKSRFNRSVGPHRVVDATDFPISDFKMIKDITGVKLNDVALAIVGGALARYLAAKDETPEESLAASLPVNMRTRRGATDDNNQVGAIFASLHTDIADPIQRLKAIHASTAEAKEFGESSPMVDALKIAGVFSPMISKAAANIWSSRGLSRFVPANTSTVITNVPGPNFDLYCAGAKMVKYHGFGVLTPGVGLFHTVFSQADRVNMSILADRDIMPDPAFYMECLLASYNELLEAARALQNARGNTGSKAAAKKSVAPAKPKPTKKQPAAKKKPAAKKASSGKRKASTGKNKVATAASKASPAKKKPVASKSRPAAKRAAAKKAPAAKNKSTGVKKAAGTKVTDSNSAPRVSISNPRPRRKVGAVAPKLRVVGS